MSQERRAKMQRLHSHGLTLREIGEEFGLSKQRVHQILGTVEPRTRRVRQFGGGYYIGAPVKKCGDGGMHFFDVAQEACLCGQIPREIFFAAGCTCGAWGKRPVHRPDCAAVAWMHKCNAWIDAHPDVDPPLDRVRYRVAPSSE